MMIVRPGKITQGESVRFRLLAEKINSRDAAGTRHILHHDQRIARNMAGEMTRDNSTFDIGWTAGGEVDQESYGLSLIKCLFRSKRGSENENPTEQKKHRCSYLNFHDLISFRVSWPHVYNPDDTTVHGNPLPLGAQSTPNPASATIISFSFTLSTLPISVSGSDERNSTDFGTL